MRFSVRADPRDPAAAIVNGALALAAQKRLGLVDARRELAALPLLGVGVLAGWQVLP